MENKYTSGFPTWSDMELDRDLAAEVYNAMLHRYIDNPSDPLLVDLSTLSFLKSL